MVSNVKYFFSKFFKSNKKNKTYASLTPTSTIEKSDEYSKALKFALDNPEIKNIAISGIYGAGKSSVIKAFFSKKENKMYNPIYISLACFSEDNNNAIDNQNVENTNNKTDKKDNSNTGTNGMGIELQHSIEKSILQQLFYRATKREIPLSRFGRISNSSKILNLIISIFVIIFIYTFFMIFSSDTITKIKTNYAYAVEQNSAIKLLSIIVILFIFVLIYKGVFLIINKANIRNIKTNYIDIDVNNKSESIFNSYLDEIIYFFQSTKHRVVIIEDIDRFGDKSIVIYQKLRELNFIINTAKQIQYEVDFIYAVSDSVFYNAEQRTKFFDFIIPVVPITSKTNSNERLWFKLEQLRNNNIINFGFDKDYINRISVYIGDQRVINNIVNEFIIYKRTLEQELIDDKKLFSMIIYKNLYPGKYSDLQKGNGVIVDLFEYRKPIAVKNILDKERKAKADKEKMLNKLENEVHEETTDLKYMILGICEELYSGDIPGKIYMDGYPMNSNEFLSCSIDKIEESRVEYRNKEGILITERSIFKYFYGKNRFVQKWKIIEKKSDEEKQKLKNEIEDIDQKIDRVENLKFMQLCSEYNCNKTLSRCNSFERFLVERGYLAEDYEDYITIFSGKISRNDFAFVFAVSNHKALPYDYKLDDARKVAERLDERDYKNKEILNMDLLDYLLREKKYNLAMEMYRTLMNKSEYSREFIEAYSSIYATEKDFKELINKYKN